MKFSSGNIYMTRNINDAIAEDATFAKEVMTSLRRHCKCDWGDVCEEDKKSNDKAIQTGDRILAAYETSKGRIWILTEADRSATTILFPEEY